MHVHAVVAAAAVAGLALLGLGPAPAVRDRRAAPTDARGGPDAPMLTPAPGTPSGPASPGAPRTSRAPSGPAEPAEAKQRGVSLGLFAEDVGFSYTPLLREIAALGATHVSLVIPLYQTSGTSSDLGLHTRFSPTLELIADTVRAARREHLEVTVFPIIRLLRPKAGEWRGTLAPADRRAWFQAYGELLGDVAALAAQTGATRLVVGSELSSLDGDLALWKPLVERIRAVFPGKLVYSANWDHYRNARLYELVDEDGVVAYFPLRAPLRLPSRPGESAKAAGTEAGTEAGLEAAWRRHKQDMLDWHAGHENPLVLTEVGYRSRTGSTAAPWDESAGGAPDLEEQRRAFAAFRKVWGGERALAGAYVWNWYGWGGPRSVGYTPRGKPAEAEVRKLLGEL
jgi:hypothetical protein